MERAIALYYIKKNRDINSLNQRNLSIMVYFTKVKKLWDELNYLKPFHACEGGAFKEIAKMKNGTKLIQFLMGFNCSYDHNKN